MNEYEAYDVIMKQLCKEMVQIAEQVQRNNSMSMQDLEKVDKLAHAKKSMLTAKAMEDANNYAEGENGDYSGRRGRGSDGRYISRDSGESYAEGYDRGYSEAMSRMQNNGGNSGHYPPPYHPNHW